MNASPRERAELARLRWLEAVGLRARWEAEGAASGRVAHARSLEVNFRARYGATLDELEARGERAAAGVLREYRGAQERAAEAVGRARAMVATGS